MKKFLSLLLTFLLIFACSSCAFSYFQGESSFTQAGFSHPAAYSAGSKAYAVDVSVHNGSIDWAAVKQSGIEYAIIRAGYCGYASGANNADKMFEENYAAAKAAGLKIGAYYYAQPTSTSSAKSQANYFLSLVNGKSFDMPLILDIEYAAENGKYTGKLYESLIAKIQGIAALCNAFCSVIKDAGYEAMIYSYYEFFASSMDASKLEYPIWIAKYTNCLEYSGSFNAWQFTSSGDVNGINGNVDLSVIYVNPVKSAYTVCVAQSEDTSSSTESTNLLVTLLTAGLTLIIKLFSLIFKSF